MVFVDYNLEVNFTLGNVSKINTRMENGWISSIRFLNTIMDFPQAYLKFFQN